MNGMVGPIIAPPATHMNPMGQNVAIGLMIVMNLLCLAYAIVMARKAKSFIPVLFLVIGAIACFMEPVVELLGHCVEAVDGQLTAFTYLGRPMPWHIALLFPVYFGVPWLYLYPRFLSGKITKKSLWITYIITCVLFWVPEIPPISLGMWMYYAPNALHFHPHTTPLWYPFYAAGMVYLGFTVICHFHDLFKGWKQLTIVPIALMVAYGGVFGLGFPVMITINMKVPHWVMELGGLLTIGLCVFTISLCGNYFESQQSKVSPTNPGTRNSWRLGNR